MWWLEEAPPPRETRKSWLWCTYRGPSAWLVWLNLLVTFFAFSPLVLYAVAVAGVLLHFTNNPFFMFAFLLFGAFSQLNRAMLISILLVSCIMFASRKVPLKVKAVTGVIELAACAQLLWFLHMAKIGFER
jgi:hypothetical protein